MTRAVYRLRRLMLERWIEEAIALLDQIDGDPDFEDDSEDDDERELDPAELGICDLDSLPDCVPK
ncbi:hypothetical protein GCM10011491_05490 [Brucella endophytica]|uniref:Uncharacterized protein n=1 Tax=Brucella endophytica TaxID=1963359 RepID=A0A916S569_9HYPH|nr:hypothetical protein [Brucella endophytica]GGA81101.1 hypothetical protein GCM10011491_05490 [Brucella endophytica]